MKTLVTIALLLIFAHAAPAQGVLDLPDNVASSGNDGVGGIERQPPGAGNLPMGNAPNAPNAPGPDAGPDLQPPTRAATAANDLQVARDLGRALPGRLGAPRADLARGGASPTLRLTDVPSGATVTLVIGLSLADVPNKGGRLAPTPDLLLGPLTAGADGTLVLPAAWLARWPAGVPLVVQFWVADASGPEGFTASNALLLAR